MKEEELVSVEAAHNKNKIKKKRGEGKEKETYRKYIFNKYINTKSFWKNVVSNYQFLRTDSQMKQIIETAE